MNEPSPEGKKDSFKIAEVEMSLLKPTILVTGFEPFGGDSINPSFEAVKRLPDRIGSSDIIKAELPVVFGAAADRLLSLIDEYSPSAVLCTGLAGGRRAITPEVIAVNLRHAQIPDNSGKQPVWEMIEDSGPDGIFAALPVREMTAAMKEARIPAEMSFSAGTFVCNELMYRLLAAQREHFPEIPAGFVHVPFADEFPHGEAFSMPLEDIVRGLNLCAGIIGKYFSCS